MNQVNYEEKKILLTFYKLYNEYMISNKLVIYLSIVITLLCFGFIIFNPTLSIDSETIMLGNENAQLTTGRFGIFLIKKFFSYEYLLMPYITNFFSAMAFLISGLIWCFNFFLLFSKASKIAQIVFIGLYLSLPSVVSEFMIFYVCNFEFTIAMICIALTISFILLYFKTNSINSLCLAILPAFFAISIYQAFSSMFITSAILCIFIQTIFQSNSITFMNFTKMVFPYAIVSVASTVSYFVVNFIIQLFYPTQGYVENYIGWKNNTSVTQVLSNIFSYILKFNSKDGFFGGQFIGFTSFLFIAFCLFIIFKSKNKIITIIIVLITLISPYLLPFALGGSQPIRSMHSLLPWIGGVWFIIINSFTVINNNQQNWSKKAAVLIATIALFIVIWQIQLLNMLFYGNQLRYELDKSMAHNIANEIMKQPNFSSAKPVVFINNYIRDPNKNILVGEVIGHSFFAWGNETNGRSTLFLNSLGYNFSTNNDLVTKYKNVKEVLEMPKWPSEGSVKEYSDVIVVKLSK